MGFNREHAIWQSADKTWNIGFFDFVNVNTDDPEWDAEWDVEYLPHFNWASTGHRSPEHARNAYMGANPGGTNHIEYTRKNARDCKELDELVKCWKSPEYAEKKRVKEMRKSVREQAEKALEEFKQQRFREHSWVTVYFGSTDTRYALEGVLKLEGDWLSVTSTRFASQKVYNVSTDKMWTGTKNKTPMGIISVRR